MQGDCWDKGDSLPQKSEEYAAFWVALNPDHNFVTTTKTLNGGPMDNCSPRSHELPNSNPNARVCNTSLEADAQEGLWKPAHKNKMVRPYYQRYYTSWLQNARKLTLELNWKLPPCLLPFTVLCRHLGEKSHQGSPPALPICQIPIC